MGTVTGIVAVMTFVGLPFLHQHRQGRLRGVLAAAGARLPQPGGLGRRHLLPGHPAPGLAHMVVGVIMCMARAVSEFGAVVIVAYHPMVAPVMIYERFTAYGLKYSQPVAVWLILVCLVLFSAAAGVFSLDRKAAA
jgi:molybdate/tungstate transport system permease protein